MNEHGFISAVHRQLPSAIYRWKINDNYEGGVADAYYSAKGGDLWIEYKYVPALPRRANTPVRTTLSTRQRHWLTRRHDEGRNVAVVIGSPDGSVILNSPDQWQQPLTRDEFLRQALPRTGLIAFITRAIIPDDSTDCPLLHHRKEPNLL
ncbi:hypothetical protein [Vreelandella jeotgali]|uniref:hypothetical protein n=1 Tax=Vreelandella jeotgali TaxID=553386 RepID=UPI000364AA0D|nr:hypothetical protein [Halomonas jeotgali]